MRWENIKNFCHFLRSRHSQQARVVRTRVFVWNWRSWRWRWVETTAIVHVLFVRLKRTTAVPLAETWSQQINYSLHAIHTHGEHTHTHSYLKAIEIYWKLRIDRHSVDYYCCYRVFVRRYACCAHHTADDQITPMHSTIIMLFRWSLSDF